MLSTKGKAAVSTGTEATAQNHNNLNRNYHYLCCKSSGKLKEQIGTLLLALQAPLSQNRQKEYWTLFDLMLRQYLDFKVHGVPV